MLVLATFCVVAQLVAGHQGAEEKAQPGENYVEYHMRTEHHIDQFDPLSFFNLHDLDRDGILDRKELEAIYGVHHETARSHVQDDAQHEAQTDEILKAVLAKLDFNRDGVVTKTEFLEGYKRGGLPNFEGVKGLGHHYDTEGEYFLHHEEIYHNTPETQTDEAYNHPEDIEHFMHHDKIEQEEERLVLKAQGLDENGVPFKYAEGESADQVVLEEKAPRARATVAQTNQANPYANLRQEAKNRGSYEGFRRPKDKVDRLRVGVPYKFRQRSSFFGDF